MNPSTHLVLTATLLSSLSALGIEVATTASDAFGNSSFNTAGVWDNAAAPAAGNNYTIAIGHRVRTPADGESYTFAGDSLTISDGAAAAELIGLSYKGSGNTATITINNLTLDGGSINHLSSGPDIFNLEGDLTIASDSLIHAKQGPINIHGPISGTASITNPGSDDPGRTLSFFSATSTFNGDLVNDGRFALADDAAFNFAVGAAGTNNAISGTGAETVLNGDLIIDISGASSALFDQWALITATNASYGATFSVIGWSEILPGEWWDPTNTWRFTTADGLLVVAPTFDSDSDGLPDLWEDMHFGNDDGNATPTELALQSGTGAGDSDGYPVPDGDGLNNLGEYDEGTDPNLADSDDDTLSDGDEVAGTSNAFDGTPTEPLDDDSDNDGLNDFEENGSLNGEFANAPTNPNSEDSDGDGMPDKYELDNNNSATALNPNDDGSTDPTQGPNGDRDSDGLHNLAEFKPDEIEDNLRPQTRADLADTDDDGYDDMQEDNFGGWGDLTETGTNPAISDTDGDGLKDGDERLDSLSPPDFPGLGILPTNSDPNVVDTDFDQFSDFYEVTIAGTDPDNDEESQIPTQPNEFTLVEDFEGAGMVINETYKNVNGWKTDDDASALLIADEPIAGGDQVGRFARPVGGNGTVAFKTLSDLGLQILDGKTGTMFFQVYTSQTNIDQSFGLSDDFFPTGFDNYEAQYAMIPDGSLGARDQSGFRAFAGGDYRVEQWMNVWIVADNSSEVFKVYVQLPDGQSGPTPADITSDSDTTPYVFRNGFTTTALASFLLIENGAEQLPIFIDNLYVDPTSENLTTPAAAKPLPTSDPAINSVLFDGGDLKITFTPGGAGFILTSSDDLAAPFTEETNASYDGIDTFTVPPAFLNPGHDFFRVEDAP